jgi:hypothetical protein
VVLWVIQAKKQCPRAKSPKEQQKDEKDEKVVATEPEAMPHC